VPIIFIHSDKEEAIMTIGEEILQGHEGLLIGLDIHEGIVHSSCRALSNKRNFGVLTT